MTTNLSIGQMLAQLERKIAHHRKQGAFHAEQEALHREQKALHDAELQTALERFEAFQAAAAAAGELVERDQRIAAPPPPAEPKGSLANYRGMAVGQLVTLLLESKTPDETFGASALTEEINRRWGSKLPRRVSSRSVSVTLRRWAAAGRLRLVRDGKAYQESLYTKAT